MKPACLLALATLAAASQAEATEARAIEARYVCDGGLRIDVQFSPPASAHGHATLTFLGSDEKLVLPQVVSADGGRYANEQIEFWIKGQGATLTRSGKSQRCTTR